MMEGEVIWTGGRGDRGRGEGCDQFQYFVSCTVSTAIPDFGWDWGPYFVPAGIWQNIRYVAWSSWQCVGICVESCEPPVCEPSVCETASLSTNAVLFSAISMVMVTMRGVMIMCSHGDNHVLSWG